MATAGKAAGPPQYATTDGRQPPGYDPTWSISPYYALAGEAPGPSGFFTNQRLAAQRAAASSAAAGGAAPLMATPSVYYNPYVAGEGAFGPAAPTYFGAKASNLPPETVALQQMAQIDPQSEALRKQIAASYISPVERMQQLMGQYQQIDPTTYAGMQELSRQLSSNLALGSYLDPSTAREVEQATRAAQGARGNVYGTPQMVEEAMQRGQAGEQRQLQREQAMQSYLASGTSPAATALNLLRGWQGGGLSYLGSGQTPYQAGAGYLSAAQQAGAAATQGGPTYQAGALGSPYSYMNPAAGMQMSQQANQWYQNMLYGQGMGGSQRNPLMGAAAGALGGAASGALTGAAAGSGLGPYGALIGAGIGAIGGGAKGYFG